MLDKGLNNVIEKKKKKKKTRSSLLIKNWRRSSIQNGAYLELEKAALKCGSYLVLSEYKKTSRFLS